jgi:hypothetical protein
MGYLMRNKLTITCFLFVVALLAACGKNQTENKAEVPKVPNLTFDDLTKLSKNEREELERRCLGVSHPTCVQLKGNSLKNHLDLKKSFCKTSAIVKNSADAYQMRIDEAKCEQL